MRLPVRAFFAVTLLGAACSDDLVHRVEIVVPPAIESIPDGRLYVALWSYDPLLADGFARLADWRELRFRHLSGRATTVSAFVGAAVSARERQYVTVAGCAVTIDGSLHVLWDGQQGTGMPSRVTMERTLRPVRCEQLWVATGPTVPLRYIPKQ